MWEEVANDLRRNNVNIFMNKPIKGIEFSSAIKNIYSMIIGSGQGNNTSSALFRKSIDEC